MKTTLFSPIGWIFLTIFSVFLSCKKDFTPLPVNMPELDFEKVYEIPGNEHFNSLTLRDSFVYAFGTKDLLDGQFYIAKYDLGGRQQFSFSLGGADKEGKEIIPTTDGNFLIVGNQFNGTDYNAEYAKINTQGQIIWYEDINEPRDTKVNRVIEDSNGNFWMFGFAKDLDDGNKDLYLVHVSASGAVLNEYEFGTPNQESGSDLVMLPNGNLMLFGVSHPDDPTDPDYFLMQVSNTGDSLWSRSYGGSAYEEAQALLRTPQGDFIMCGHSASMAAEHNMFCVKVNGSGDVIWEKEYGGSFHDGGQAALINAEGHYVFVARSNSFEDNSQGAYMVTADGQGNILSEDFFGFDGADDRIDAIIEYGGAYYMAGQSNSAGNGDYDGYLIRHCLTD